VGAPLTPQELALARLSADEIVSALKLSRAPAAARALVRAAFVAVSVPLGRTLARFDARIASAGPSGAAAAALDDFGAKWKPSGERPPARGALVVVANHPGAYDALALLAAVGRDDVAIVAADRPFLRAMPGLMRHLILVPDSPGAPETATAMARMRGLRDAIAHLKRGGVLLHFAAGCIEPDPAFPVPPGAQRLAPWRPGTGRLVRAASGAGGAVVAALVEGVHSRRAKELPLVRLAESYGVTTLAPLLQVAIPPFRDVAITARFASSVRARDLAGGRDDARITAVVRDRALALWPSLRLHEETAERGDRVVPSR
jgi:hypothetical protein